MKRHPLDTVSLVFGLLFAGAAAWWLSSGPDRVGGGWFGIGALAIIGTVGLLSAVFRRPRRTEPQEVSEP